MNTQEKLKETELIVDANSYEQFALWKEYSKTHNGDNPKYATWKEESAGVMVTLGELAGMPVCLSLSWAVIEGKRVMFVYQTSMVTDWRMVKEYLEENCPNVKTVDATNFYPGLLRRSL
jgi:hypothetical protein